MTRHTHRGVEPCRLGSSCSGAAVKNVVNLFTFGVGGDILVDAWDYWQRASREEQRAADVQAVAQMSAAELRTEVCRIVREEAAALPAEQQAQVASYLSQVPAAIRRSLRRPSDPTGTTIAEGTGFRKPEDLLPLLPASHNESIEEAPEAALDADCRGYEEWICYGHQKDEEFLRKHAPARIDAWRLAAEQGKPEGQVLLGRCLQEGIEIAKDAEEAWKWLQKAAEQGFPSAQAIVGATYVQGGGVPKDPGKGFKWMRKAAEQGFPPAQLRLAEMYQDGTGVLRDEDEAAKWFQKVFNWLRRNAERGSPLAQGTLGMRYAEGQGVTQNDAEAVKWLLMAAEQDFGAAAFGLGVMYLHGRGVSADADVAIKWIRKSAELGCDAAQHVLGLLYERGLGVEKNATEAREWYRKAAEQGHTQSKEALKRLEAPSFWRRILGI